MNMNEQTLQKMKQMKLLGMARAFSTSLETGSLNNFTTDEMVSQLTIAEWDDRNNRRIERQVKNARFRYKAHI
jgi:esterase/lipase superfamily enzyme